MACLCREMSCLCMLVQMLLSLCKLCITKVIKALLTFNLSSKHLLLFWSLRSVTRLILWTHWTWSSMEASKALQNGIKQRLTGTTVHSISTLAVRLFSPSQLDYANPCSAWDNYCQWVCKSLWICLCSDFMHMFGWGLEGFRIYIYLNVKKKKKKVCFDFWSIVLFTTSPVTRSTADRSSVCTGCEKGTIDNVSSFPGLEQAVQTPTYASHQTLENVSGPTLQTMTL